MCDADGAPRAGAGTSNDGREAGFTNPVVSCQNRRPNDSGGGYDDAIAGVSVETIGQCRDLGGHRRRDVRPAH